MWVTPCMGVWIEIKICFKSSSLVLVTPCMGVWIEIPKLQKFLSVMTRHSLYGSVD